MPFSCFLFRPRKNREKHRKRCHTNVSNTLVTRSSTPPAQTPHVRFHERKWVHTRLSEKDRTQGLTRRNTGRFGWGRYCYPRTVSRVLEPLRGQGVKRRTLPLLGLGRGYSRRTQRACGTAMRLCASLSRRRRGSAGLRRPTPPAERTVLAPISPRVQLCLRRPAFPLSAFIPGA